MEQEIFKGYQQAGREFIVFEHPTDVDLPKWRALRSSMLSATTVQVPADWSAIADFNADINGRVIWRKNDEWQSPDLTRQIGRGDCMDITALKYEVLRCTVGEENVAIALGEIANLIVNEQHAWLAVRLGGEIKVLDSKFPQLIAVKGYDNWIPLKILYGDSLYLCSPVQTIAQRLKPSGV